MEDRRLFDGSLPQLVPVLEGPPEWDIGRTTFTATLPANPGLLSYSINLAAGTSITIVAARTASVTPLVTLADPGGNIVKVASSVGVSSAVVQAFPINQAGQWTISLVATAQGGAVPVRVVVGAANEASDTSPTQRLDINASLSTIGGAHFAVLGLSQPGGGGVDVDEYSVDLSSRLGQTVDVVWRGLAGASFRDQRLEVIAPNGTTVLRVGANSAFDWSGTPFDVGALDFRVQLPGVYRVRVTSAVAGEYLLAVADRLPQQQPTARERLDLLVGLGETTLGSTDALLATLTFQRVYERYTSDEFLSLLIRESLVQGYGSVDELWPALTVWGVELRGLRPDGILTALEFAWFGSLLRDSSGQSLTAPAARQRLEERFNADKTALLDDLSTLRLLELFDDKFTTRPDDPTDHFLAFTRRKLLVPQDNVIAAYRVQMLLPDYTYGPLPSGTAAAPQVNLMPAGQRVLYVRDLHYVDGFGDFHIDTHDADGKPYDYYMLWMDEWEKIVRQRYEAFFSQLHAAGGDVDLVMIDFEKKSLSHWELQGDRRINRNATPAVGFWETVTADPRWGEIRDRLLKAGFRPEELTASALRSWSSRDIREARWNAVMEELYSERFHRALVEPVLRYFPGAAIVNYGEGYRSSTHPYGNFAKLRQSYFTTGHLTGTHQSPVLYSSPGTVQTPQGELAPATLPKIEIDTISAARIVQDGVPTSRAAVTVRLRSPAAGMQVGDQFSIANNRAEWIDPAYEGRFHIESISADLRVIGYTITLSDGAAVPAAYDLTHRVNTTSTAFFSVWSSYNGFVGDMMELRSHVATSDAPLLPWISSPQFLESRTELVYEHYVEGIFHAALSGAENFQLWKWSALGTDTATDEFVSDVLHELDELIGFENRFTLSRESILWQDGYVLTGMEAGGRRVWRLTPDPSLPFQQLAGPGARFQIGSKIVEIPGGAVYTPAAGNSSLGVWIVETSVPSYLNRSASTLAALLDSPAGSTLVSATGGHDEIVIRGTADRIEVTINGAVQSFDRAATPSLIVDALGGDDTITVIGSGYPLAGVLTIVGGDGDDTLTLTTAGSTAQGFNALSGELRFRGGTGNDTLRLDNAASATSMNVFVYRSSIYASGMGRAIQYNDDGYDLERVEINLGSSHDIIGIASLSADTTINAGAGNDFFTVMQGLTKVVTYNAGAGDDWLSPLSFGNYDDRIYLDKHSLLINSGLIHYRQVEVIDLYTYGGNDWVEVQHDNSIGELPGIIRLTAGPGGASGIDGDVLVIRGTSDHDVMAISDFAARWPGRYQLAGFEWLGIFGGDGNDYINHTATINTLIDGGRGNDVLMGGRLTDLIFGGEGVDYLIGNEGNDLLAADHDRFGRLYLSGGDRVDGGSGFDRVAALGADTVWNTEQSTTDAMLRLDPVAQSLLALFATLR